jgi:phage terminase large subunit GpA-like protein
VSLLANASWAKLAAEYERVKDDPTTLKVFTNTILGQPWRGEGNELDELELKARAEPFSLDAIPPEVLAISVGCDVQGDRLEASVVGWGRDGTAFVLAHQVLWGPPDDDEVWKDLDGLLRSRWKSPLGGSLRVDAAAIDAGDLYDTVLAFCQPRLGRKVFAIKGQAGFARPAIARAKLKKGKPLFLVGRGRDQGRAVRQARARPRSPLQRHPGAELLRAACVREACHPPGTGPADSTL